MSQHGYYVTRLSENIGKTPEGFLICKNVPLSRTGWQEYIGREIDPKGDSTALDSRVRVYRSEQEVFQPDAMSSFDGKAVTYEHPNEWVTSGNINQYHRGHVQNIRRGSGEFRDCVLGDMVIMDDALIHKVESGLREVSCGYFCTYEPIGQSGDMFAQKQIRGNHVAVVPNGRAGDRVAIRDSAETLLNNNPTANKKKVRSTEMINIKKLLGLGLKEYAKDAEPEAVAEAFEVAKQGHEAMTTQKDALPMPEEKKEAPPTPAPAAEGGGKDDRMIAMLEKMLGVLEGIATKVEGPAAAPVAPKPEPEEQLDDFAKAFGGQETPEEEEQEGLQGGEAPFRDAEVCTDIPPMSGEDLPENPIPGADSKAALDAINAMKPVIAQMKNKADKQMAVDALMNQFRRNKTPGKQKASYADFHNMKRANDSAAEARKAREIPGPEMGEDIAKKFHRKNAE